MTPPPAHGHLAMASKPIYSVKFAHQPITIFRCLIGAWIMSSGARNPHLCKSLIPAASRAAGGQPACHCWTLRQMSFSTAGPSGWMHGECGSSLVNTGHVIYRCIPWLPWSSTFCFDLPRCRRFEKDSNPGFPVGKQGWGKDCYFNEIWYKDIPGVFLISISGYSTVPDLHRVKLSHQTGDEPTELKMRIQEDPT